MMESEFYFREKIPVSILGATGSVGQQFISLLEHHPWFQISTLCASERSVGKKYREVVNWLQPKLLPEWIGDMTIQPCEPTSSGTIAFSGLDSSVAGEIETAYANAGCIVVSNSKNHRMDPQVPLLVPEVNPNHLELIEQKSKEKKGFIVTNPNCCVVGLVMALKPLIAFGIEQVHVTTMQSVSGAGYPGVASLDILDNVIPFISGEEEKLQTEPGKILGDYKQGFIQFWPGKISAQCNRVPVTEGHMECVSLKLSQKVSLEEVKNSWKEYRGYPQELQLPSAASIPIRYFEQEKYPQPKLHRYLDRGMSLSIGRLQNCPLLDYKFVLLTHNTIAGAAGCAILNAELLVKKGYIFW